jgi:chromate transport protein ChrA
MILNYAKRITGLQYCGFVNSLINSIVCLVWPSTIILIYLIEEIKLIRKWRAVQRFILFTESRNKKKN